MRKTLVTITRAVTPSPARTSGKRQRKRSTAVRWGGSRMLLSAGTALGWDATTTGCGDGRVQGLEGPRVRARSEQCLAWTLGPLDPRTLPLSRPRRQDAPPRCCGRRGHGREAHLVQAGIERRQQLDQSAEMADFG